MPTLVQPTDPHLPSTLQPTAAQRSRTPVAPSTLFFLARPTEAPSTRLKEPERISTPKPSNTLEIAPFTTPKKKSPKT